jgi:protein required for attachment to host cells
MSSRTVGVPVLCQPRVRFTGYPPSTHDLGMERPGRAHESAGSAHHALQLREDLHRAAKRDFVYEVARALNEANTRNEFDHLILVAPAHALGELNHALDAPTRRKIAAQLQKDLRCSSFRRSMDRQGWQLTRSASSLLPSTATVPRAA